MGRFEDGRAKFLEYTMSVCQETGNDSRKIGGGSKVVNPAWGKWQDHVVKWEIIADDLGMKVEFTYWGKHEISLMLQRNEPRFEGRAHYLIKLIFSLR